MPDLQAACFDLDGCLVDSTAAITGAINQSLVALDLPPQDPASLTWFVGPPLRESYVRLLPELGADRERADEAVAAYRAVYGPIALERTEVIPGIPALLAELECPLLVVTSKPTHFAVPILEHLELLDAFEAVHGPDLAAVEEAKADTLARALRTADLDQTAPTSIAMIGDRRHDIAAGRAHRCTTVGVTWGAGDREELHAAGATYVLDTVDQLREVLA